MLMIKLLTSILMIGCVCCNIYDPANFLFTQRCKIANLIAVSNYPFVLSTPQSNIVSAGIVLSEYSIYQNNTNPTHIRFTALLDTYGASQTSFTIKMTQVISQFLGMAFFLIVVKLQTIPCFDIIDFAFGNATVGSGSGTRTANLTKTISTTSMFTTFNTTAMVATLDFKVFATSFYLTKSSANITWFEIYGEHSTTSIKVSLKAWDSTIIKAFRGVLVVWHDSNLISAGVTRLSSASPKLIDTVPDKLASDWGLKDFGPDFNGKCLFGLVQLQTNTTYRHYLTMDQNKFEHYYRIYSGSNSPTVQFICLGGTKTGCGDQQTYRDFASPDICRVGSECPLPVPSVQAWSSTVLCPPCIQLICTTCLATNRSDCQTCGPNSHIQSGICVCDTGMIPVTSLIPTGIQPAWGGTVFSLQRCSINCTYYISNCQQTSCTSQTYCTGCITPYVAKNIDATNQNCRLCSQLWTNCVSCTSQTTCDTCGSGYYLLAPGCDQCKNSMDRCLTCSNDGLTCNSCQPGFNPLTNFCQCIPSYHSLTACLACNFNIECTSCDSANGYYLKGTVCDLCSNTLRRCLTCTHDGVTCNSCEAGFNAVSVIGCECIPSYHSIANCLTCNLDIECTSCVAGYYVLGITCDQCSNPLAHCLVCTSSSVCTSCDIGYYVNGNVCDICSNPMRRCLTCTSDGVTCNSCEAGFNSVSGVGCECIPSFHSIANCLTCNLDIECTSCAVGYYVLGIACDTCSNPLAHCLVCTSSSVCTSCDIGYYVNGNVCDICSNPMLGCLECSSSSVCTRCDAGFDLISNKCRCNPNFHPLAFCATCTTLTACDTCVSNSYFVASADKLCNPCNSIHAQCLTCSSQNICTSCSVTWMLVTQGNGSTLCAPCVPLTPNCTTCSPNPTTCINCDFLFGVNSSAQCQRCNTLLGIPYCESCEDNTACLSCLSENVLIAGDCRFCRDFVILCKECVYVPVTNKVNCTQCYDNYYATLNPLTGYNECKKCLNLFQFCNTCNSSNCFSCLSPYVLGSTGLCDQCITGYFYMSGFCTNINGCQSSVISPSGIATCIACISELHFTYDTVLKKCVCLSGFNQIFQINALSRCQPICGDGVFLNGVEQCDDNNTKNNDGCDEHCKIESGFKCSTQEPTKCVLHFNFNYFIFNYATRQIGENKVKVSYFVWPAHAGLIGANWKAMLKLNFTQTAVDPNSIQFSYSLQTGELIVLAPYKESLEDVGLQSVITFDKNVIVSDPSTITFSTTLKGSTSPLIYEPDAMVQTAKNIGTMSLVLVILLLLQFYLGSYVHKMIGLQTIQVIQSIYFARMIAKSPPTSILSSMNVMDYSASGYENSEILFGKLGQIKDQFDSLQNSQFFSIGMQKFFLLNVNLSMVPVFIGVVVYFVSLCRKFSSRNKVMQFKQQEEKDNYTRLKRSSQWVYDHTVFPLVMMFNQISFYFTVSQLSSNKATLPEPALFQNIEISSFAVHLVILFMTTGLYINEIFNSYFQYKKFSMTDQEKAKVVQSAIELLQHDTNNPDRANYHPIYVLVYMLYYLCLEMVIVSTIFFPQFKFVLECTIGISGVYFLLICFWSPYHKSANVHNHLLKLYYGTFVAFLVIQYLLTKNLGIPHSTYAVLMYIIMGLLGAILAAGFGRIYLQYRFRKQLDNDDNLLEWKQQKTQIKNEQLESKKDKKQLLNKKRLALFDNNPYLFQNQVNQLRGGLNKKINSTFNQQTQNKAKFQQPENEDFFIKQLRDEINLNRQHIIFQNQLKDYHKKYNKKQKPTKQHLIQQYNKQGQQGLKEEQGVTNEQLRKKKDDLSTLENIKNKLRAEWISLDD